MRWTALLILAAGVALRVAVAREPPIVTPDSEGRYEPLAHNLAAGHGFSTASAPPYAPDRLSQPGYPVFLAAIELVAGTDRRAVVVAQLVVELGGVLCLVLIARRAGLAPPAQLATAALALLCPVLPTLARALWSETLATTALTATCLAWVVCLREPARRVPWLLAGAGAAACILTRADLLPAVGLALTVVVVRARRRGALRGLALFAVAPVLLVGAWMARNQAELGAPQPLGGYAGQVESPYVAWLGTWVDDLRFMAPYHWYVRQPSSPVGFPSDRVLDADERARADAALGEARRAGSFDVPAVRATFTELTAEARRKRPLRTFVLVPLRRVASTWYNLAAAYSRSPWVRGAWLGFLGIALAGAAWARKRRTDLVLLFGAVVVGRSVLPFAIGIGVEPRYVAEALPACFLFASLLIDAFRHTHCSLPGA